MNDLTEEWLESINEEFRKNDIPHKQRPWLAWREWAKYKGISVSLNDEVVKKIFAWFENNAKAGSQYLGSMYTGVYYYDSCFWPVFIPIVFGSVQLNARDSVKTMPETIVARLWRDRNEVTQYASLWADCTDYAFGIDDLMKGKAIGGFAQEVLASGDQQLNATVTLLLEDRPNPKAMESARMATEMFLKAFLAATGGLTEKEAKDKIGHNLEKALNRCLTLDAKSELQAIQPDLNVFPDIGDRYKGTEKPSRELWIAYGAAQFTGTTVARSLSGRDVRKTMKMS